MAGFCSWVSLLYFSLFLTYPFVAFSESCEEVDAQLNRLSVRVERYRNKADKIFDRCDRDFERYDDMAFNLDMADKPIPRRLDELLYEHIECDVYWRLDAKATQAEEKIDRLVVQAKSCQKSRAKVQLSKKVATELVDSLGSKESPSLGNESLLKKTLSISPKHGSRVSEVLLSDSSSSTFVVRSCDLTDFHDFLKSLGNFEKRQCLLSNANETEFHTAFDHIE